MKNNKLWLRVLSLCLAVVCTFSIVAAATDLSGDGKTDVWDLQKAANENKDATVLADILKAALGGHDELHANDAGVYEIYSPLGLYNMAKHASEEVTFVLMNDIDMKGVDWTPVSSFAGTFEGNDKTISNVNITKPAEANSKFQGFFGKVSRAGTVQNLNLENVMITASEAAEYIGLVAGSIVGNVKNCTTIGKVIDNRTTLSSHVYIGTLVGRIENVTDPGSVVISNTLTATAGSGLAEDKGQTVVSKMAMDYADLTFAEGATVYKRNTGTVGWGPAGTYDTSYNWQDISGSTDLIDPVLEQRRQAVVDKMYDICTVEWTPSQDMTIHYYKTKPVTGELNYETKTWTAGKVYRGMPYNHGSGSLERFMAWMDAGTTTDYKTKTTLPTEAYYYTLEALRNEMTNHGASATYQDPNFDKTTSTSKAAIKAGYVTEDGTYDLSHGYKLADQPMTEGEVKSADHAGFSRYIGNDCSSAIQWAWRSVVSSDVPNGGTVISGVTQMAPLITTSGQTNYQTRYGVLPVGGLVPYGTGVASWEAYCAEQGEDAFFNAYAQASKGDGLIMFATAGGHSRMIAYDPICIRDYKGEIDENNSYIITHEQGRSSSGTDNGVSWSSTCYANCLYTFDQLYNYAEYPSGIGSRGYYMPMTLPAFHDVNSKAVSSTVTVSGNVVKSNFHIVSTAVDGNEVFTAVGQHQSTNTTTRVGSGYRDAHIQEDLAAIHGDLTGKTVTVRLANGDTYSVNMSTGVATKN